MSNKWWNNIDISGLGLAKGKHPCLKCNSSDAMHVYESHAHCFSCGESFDAPAILMAQTGCTFVEALSQLKGTRSHTRNPQELAHMFEDTQQRIDDSFDPPFECDNPWNEIGDALANQPLCQTTVKWLISRGLDPEMCHGLGIRSMHPTHWKHVKSLVGGEAAARKAGIIADSKKTGQPYQLPWWNYPWVLLPYTDAEWIWTTVRHRATNPKDEPKILSPAGSQPAPLPFLGAKAQDTDGPLWVVEGETDALSLWQIGQVAVASPGASVWHDAWRAWLAEQAKTRDVLIVGDGDEAGVEFVRNVSRGMNQGRVERALWADGRDANDLLLSNELETEISEIRK